LVVVDHTELAQVVGTLLHIVAGSPEEEDVLHMVDYMVVFAEGILVEVLLDNNLICKTTQCVSIRDN
jgi:hypothetical protein